MVKISIIMTLVLIISCTASTQVEVLHYKKYKNFKYEKFDYKSINIRYYIGKKVFIPEKNQGNKSRTSQSDKSQIFEGDSIPQIGDFAFDFYLKPS